MTRHHSVLWRLAPVALWIWATLRAGGGPIPHLPTQQSLDEWRVLTSPTSAPPRVFARGDKVRFYFPRADGVEVFVADWDRVRLPTDDYHVASAVLRWNQKLSRMPARESSWREAVVISGQEWQRLATNLVAALTPVTPMHGTFYESLLTEGLFFRDAKGVPRFVTASAPPADLTIERRYSMDETLQVVAEFMEAYLHEAHPGESLFLVMAPTAKRFAQPVLLDRQHRRCVLFSPAALYDSTDRGLSFGGAANSLSAILIEGHGLALVKNPVSSAFRLLDLGLQTGLRFLRLPLPRSSKSPDLPADAPAGMDLDAWEHWLDTYTGTRPQEGNLSLLIDGERFFPRLQQAIAEATNHIHFEVYIFDRDDVAVEVADKLKARSKQIEVKVLTDRLGTLGAGASPPETPLPEHFTMPPSILSYLRQDSKVKVRSFLNPWFSADHSKVLMVDGNYAWVGGMNIGREYRYEWHDLMVEITGPVVAALERDFYRDWAHEGPLGDLSYAVAAIKGRPKVSPQPPSGERWMRVRLLPTRTLWKPMDSAVLAALRHARSYIYAENPYLYDKRVAAALVHARRRGVDVRVVLPRVNDFKVGRRSNLVTANYLRAHGIRVYFYPGMTHVKALLVDDWACLGSANLNHLSLKLCQEQNIATSDPDFAMEVKRDLFETDFSRSYELEEPISLDWVDFVTDAVMENF